MNRNSEKQHNLENELKGLSQFSLTEEESTEAFQTIMNRIRISKTNKQANRRLYVTRAFVTTSTLFVITIIGWFIYSGMSPEHDSFRNASNSNQLDGIELEITVDKKHYSLYEDLIANVTLTNHTNKERVIYVPTSVEEEEGIAAVMIEKRNETAVQFLDPKTNLDLPNINGRVFDDYVQVTLGANETIEQKFQWNKALFIQETEDIVPADTGEYILSSFIVLDLQDQTEYAEPEKQLITKLTLNLYDKEKPHDLYTEEACVDTAIVCVNARTKNNAVKVSIGSSQLDSEEGRMIMGDRFEHDINMETLLIEPNGTITLEFIYNYPEKLTIYQLDHHERGEGKELELPSFQAPAKSGYYTYEIDGVYSNGHAIHYLQIKVN
ncbi:hypothetical protein KGF86_01985 [Ornithinibacillus massiliensis]|uniref:DUF4179 domain-containing protein n=1 Tax=Ornithinibacillus massiliensis TaxID=1944633 RepID=A0ABS5M9I1_9BACI|nr:hypothetical protein [Ornithinibacillus massiliensis]MBS3678971.1 hypothetical protein [Ornithinibacillus massiliensis]